MSYTSSDIARFRRTVFSFYKTHGRHTLAWRKTTNPYRILVSEIMLQQTQVERVIPYYRAWLKRFPTAKALAEAPLSDVLRVWQGLGYNRRAKMLHEAGKALTLLPTFPRTAEALEALPGIGPYTARAVLAFAFNTPDVFIETNIRTVIIHHFFSRPTSSRPSKDTAELVGDGEVREMLLKALPQRRAREWYYALMDYGAHLKKGGMRLNARSKGYVKQKKFAGSMREARGAILRTLAKGPVYSKSLYVLLGTDRRGQVQSALSALTKEGLVNIKKEIVTLA